MEKIGLNIIKGIEVDYGINYEDESISRFFENLFNFMTTSKKDF